MTEQLSSAEYLDAFPPKSEERKEAHKLALEIRKFEIDLYWRRASYFWTLIGASLVAYGGAQAIRNDEVTRDLSVFVSCFGLVVSFAWYCANRGSKQWQENWENHVDLLEDEITGPLYKVTWARPDEKKLLKRLSLALTGPGPFSVSKINQLVSVYVVLLWVALIAHSLLPLSRAAAIRWDYVTSVGTSIVAVAAIWFLGRTHQADHSNMVFRRRSGINEPDPTGASREDDTT